MNRILLITLFLVMAVNTYPQTPIEVKTTDGRIVILKPDGTWEFKKYSPQPSPSSVASADKPNIQADSLTPNFTGDDYKTLIKQLRDLKKRLVKSEFETTADYEKRAMQERQKPILNNRTVGDKFSIVIPLVRAEYDADSQKMRFFLPVEKSLRADLNRRLNTYRDKKAAYDLEDVNHFSIQWNDNDAYSYGRMGIFFDEFNGLALNEGYRGAISAEVSLGVEEAKLIKRAVKAVAIVQFEEPYAGDLEEQLQVSLKDVYFFDSQSGRVLVKLSRAGK